MGFLEGILPTPDFRKKMRIQPPKQKNLYTNREEEMATYAEKMIAICNKRTAEINDRISVIKSELETIPKGKQPTYKGKLNKEIVELKAEREKLYRENILFTPVEPKPRDEKFICKGCNEEMYRIFAERDCGIFCKGCRTKHDSEGCKECAH
jgi:hypothetical protein